MVQIRSKSQTILDKNYFNESFFQNPYYFHTGWVIFEGLATKVYPKTNKKIIRIRFTPEFFKARSYS
jgi:hypothetical protein